MTVVWNKRTTHLCPDTSSYLMVTVFYVFNFTLCTKFTNMIMNDLVLTSNKPRRFRHEALSNGGSSEWVSLASRWSDHWCHNGFSFTSPCIFLKKICQTSKSNQYIYWFDLGECASGWRLEQLLWTQCGESLRGHWMSLGLFPQKIFCVRDVWEYNAIKNYDDDKKKH